MSKSTATEAGNQPALDDVVSSSERLTHLVRETLASEQSGAFDSKIELVIACIMAELCPPNHLLISAEVIREHDAGVNDPSGWEPPYDFATVSNFKILRDTLEDEHTVLLACAAELGESMPDGACELEREILERIQPRQEPLPRAATEIPNPFSHLSLLPSASETTDRNAQ